MPEGFFDVSGDAATVEVLEIPRAQKLASFLLRRVHPWARYIETRIEKRTPVRRESVIFEVDVEVSQIARADIRSTERVCVSFAAADDSWPEVLALRQDFPSVPHLYLRPQGLPRSLCLYEQPYAEERLRWNTVSIVEHLRSWLRDTGQGELHRRDQPLEQLFLSTRDAIVLNPNILTQAAQGPMQLQIAHLNQEPWGQVYLALNADLHSHFPGSRFMATTCVSPPILHGLIRSTPQTLLDLQTIVTSAGGDLLNPLRTQLGGWAHDPGILNSHLVLVVVFPRKRETHSEPEDAEMWAFVTLQTIGVIGEALSVWQFSAGIPIPGRLVGASVDPMGGSHISLMAIHAITGLDQNGSARMNGASPDSRKIAAIGMGALGSQIAGNLVRSGFGRWSLLDGDILLPHNVARHELGHGFVGSPKADAMMQHLNCLLSEPVVERALFVDVLRPEEKQAELSSVLEQANAIFDFSASLSVARDLALSDGIQSRCLSVFMNPSGSASIALCEDKARKLRLDSLEMQYYRAVVHDPALANHFKTDSAGQVRHARSCRDVSSTLPQSSVALHAAIASKRIPELSANEEAQIIISTADGEGNVQSVRFLPEEAVRLRLGRWTLVTDRGLISRLFELRAADLPGETGGVLLGVWDLIREIVYVADTIPAPADSKRMTTTFIRGSAGLLDDVIQVEKETGGMLQYVGEWHSHPDGYDPYPSAADLSVFAWIKERTAEGGYPAVMAIAGEFEIRWFVDSIEDNHPNSGALGLQEERL